MKILGVSLLILAASPLLAAPPFQGKLLPAENTPATATPPLEDRRRALDQVFKDAWEDTMRHAPEFASMLGDKRYNDKISDFSPQAVLEGVERDKTSTKRIMAIDPAGFTSQEMISRELFIEQTSQEVESLEFKEWEMPVNQMGGFHNMYQQLVAQLSFSTVKDYDDWIARLHAMPRAFDQNIENMKVGVADHLTPPKYLLVKVLDQVKEMSQKKPEESPLAQPLRSFPATISTTDQARIKKEVLEVIGKEIAPSYSRLQAFLETTYIPAGRSEPGVSSLPNGARFYAMRIRHTTTSNLTAGQIHQIGIEEVARDEAEMLVIAKKLGFADLKSLQASIKTDPKLKPTSAAALLAAYEGYLGPMKAKLPDLFGRLPKAGFEVAAVPDFAEKDAADAYYEAGTPDGKRPGRIRINTYKPTTRDLTDVEDTAYHEGLPGHHLQISIAQELEGVPDFRKFGGYTAFEEGWGLYAERLGKDVGFYQDPYSDYGRLQGDILRAIRLVVDTGVHSQHWTRDQMIQYFHDHSSINENSVQTETDRYIAWPSQALAYKIGQMKILELRERAKTALGPKFDIRGFHDAVLDSGALPLNVLDTRVNDWIAAQKN